MATSPLLVMSALMLGATPQGVVYEFTASWCGPCQQMSPMVSRLQRQGYPIKKVDVDRYREFAGKYRISSIPAFVLVVDGQEVQRIVGATTESKLKSMLARIPRNQPTNKPGTMVADNSTSGRRAKPRPAVKPTKAKTRFQIPFLGRAEPEPADISEATIRANLDEIDDESPAVSPVATPMEASVRIRAHSGSYTNFGSGTIISSADGRTLILTCGHICRGMKRGSMEVDVFHNGSVQTYLGKILRFNEKADVGLLEIPTDEVYPHSPIAPVGDLPRKGDPVASVGCGGGDDPTLQQHRVIRLNFNPGPDFLVCTGEPIEGRSGGGLFNAQNELIGVCFGRSEEDRCGYYTGLKPIQLLLKQSGLAHLYQPKSEQPATEADEPLLANQQVELNAESVVDDGQIADVNMTEDELNPAVAAATTQQDGLPPGESPFEELKQAIAEVGEAEVVCVVRPINNPQASSRVVILNRANPQLIRYLTEDFESELLYNMTSMKIPTLRPVSDAQTHGDKSKPTHRSAKVPAKKQTGPRRYRRTRRK